MVVIDGAFGEGGQILRTSLALSLSQVSCSESKLFELIAKLRACGSSI